MDKPVNTICIMQLYDYEQVYALWQICPEIRLSEQDDSKEAVEKYLERNPDTSFVALQNGMIVGAILSGHDGRRGYIGHTAVHPDFQNQGIGKALVQAAVQALEKHGIRKINLVVFDWNVRANAFWKGLGFSDRPDLVYRNKYLDADQ